jgi:hypothetical protein
MSYKIEFEYNSEVIRSRFGMGILRPYFLMNILLILLRLHPGESANDDTTQGKVETQRGGI